MCQLILKNLFKTCYVVLLLLLTSCSEKEYGGCSQYICGLNAHHVVSVDKDFIFASYSPEQLFGRGGWLAKFGEDEKETVRKNANKILRGHSLVAVVHLDDFYFRVSPANKTLSQRELALISDEYLNRDRAKYSSTRVELSDTEFHKMLNSKLKQIRQKSEPDDGLCFKILIVSALRMHKKYGYIKFWDIALEIDGQKEPLHFARLKSSVYDDSILFYQGAAYKACANRSIFSFDEKLTLKITPKFTPKFFNTMKQEGHSLEPKSASVTYQWAVPTSTINLKR